MAGAEGQQGDFVKGGWNEKPNSFRIAQRFRLRLFGELLAFVGRPREFITTARSVLLIYSQVPVRPVTPAPNEELAAACFLSS